MYAYEYQNSKDSIQTLSPCDRQPACPAWQSWPKPTMASNNKPRLPVLDFLPIYGHDGVHAYSGAGGAKNP